MLSIFAYIKIHQATSGILMFSFIIVKYIDAAAMIWPG